MASSCLLANVETPSKQQHIQAEKDWWDDGTPSRVYEFTKSPVMEHTHQETDEGDENLHISNKGQRYMWEQREASRTERTIL